MLIFTLINSLEVKVVCFEKKPVIFEDENGDIQGIAKDILDIIGKKNNWNLSFELTTFPDALEKVSSNKADLMVPIGYTAKRDSILEFSTIPVISSWGTVVSRANNPIESIIKLEGKRIAYVKNSMFKKEFQKFTQKFKVRYELIEVQNYNQMFQLIKSSKIDGGIGDKMSMLNLAFRDRQEFHESIIFHPFEMYFVENRQNNKNLIESINNYLLNDASGTTITYSDIINKWQSEYKLNDIYPENQIIIVLFIVIIFFLILSLKSNFVRKVSGFDILFTTKASHNTLFAGLFVAIFAWILDVMLNYLWFNENEISFFNLFLIKYDMQHMILRMISFLIIFIGSIIIALLVEKLSLDKAQSEMLAEKLSTTLNSIGDAVITTFPDGKIDIMNPIAQDLTGWSMSDAAGKTLPEVFDLSNALTGEKADCPVEKVIKYGKIVGLANHTVLKSKDNKEYQIADSAAPIRNSSGEISGVVLVFRDVTQEYELHEKIRKSKERFDNVLKAVPDLVSLHDKEMNIIYSNWNGVFKVTDSKKKTGTKCYNSYRNRNSVCTECKADIVFKSGEPHHEEIKLENNTWIDLRTFPIKNKNGDIDFLVEWVRDISDRKKAENLLKENKKRLDLALEGADLGSWDLDSISSSITVNRRYAELVGYKLEEVSKNLNFWKEIIHKDDIAKVLEKMQQHYEGIVEIFECELRIKHKSGKWLWVLDRGKIIERSPDGEPLRICGTRLDITDRKKSEALIKEKNKELENYLYVASHDLRSPLVNIQGFTSRISRHSYLISEMVKENCPVLNENDEFKKISEEQIPQSMNFIFNNVKKMDILINGLLKISRTGRAPMIVEKINMNSLIQSTLNSLKYEIDEYNIEVNIKELPDCFGDKNLLNQLFSNIISNAVKYRKKEENLDIDIFSDTDEIYNNYHIRDTGIGIETKNLERIWNVFYRAGTKQDVEGEGLGLSIVKRIAEKHKGQVNLRSEIGKGTEVIVSLNRAYFE